MRTFVLALCVLCMLHLAYTYRLSEEERKEMRNYRSKLLEIVGGEGTARLYDALWDMHEIFVHAYDRCMAACTDASSASCYTQIDMV